MWRGLPPTPSDSSQPRICWQPSLSNSSTSSQLTDKRLDHRIGLGRNFKLRKVAGTGDFTLRAGKAVEIGNETSVDIDGRLTIEIDPDLQLIPPP